MQRTPQAERGFSLIELMTAITIGLLILVGLTSVFVNSSNANREMKNTAEQIESGRYAIEFLTQDIRHAGYYGELTTLPAVPASAPDPCAAPTAGTVSNTVNPGLTLPLQRISSASIPTGCASLLTAANLAPNSDIVVVRRADTTMLPVTSATTATVTTGTVYIQTSADTAEIQYGAGGTVDSTQKASGAATALFRRDFTVAATGTPPQFPIIAAGIRKYRTHIYFVAPCSVPNGGGSLCTGSSDDLGNPIPTLKRLEFTDGGSGAFSIVPIVEGIEAIRIEYGVDSSPSTADPGTGLVGDGIPESYSNAPSLADMGNTVAARIYVLARNTSPTRGYVDDKAFVMGSLTTVATGDPYKRHVYGGETRIVNQAGRREIPQ
ncbi:MAG: PilW family protein [Betaproteobacteria bacterium]|nr:PilW family protein [Betaproteobacteria bacterium]